MKKGGVLRGGCEVWQFLDHSISSEIIMCFEWNFYRNPDSLCMAENSIKRQSPRKEKAWAHFLFSFHYSHWVLTMERLSQCLIKQHQRMDNVNSWEMNLYTRPTLNKRSFVIFWLNIHQIIKIEDISSSIWRTEYID